MRASLKHSLLKTLPLFFLLHAADAQQQPPRQSEGKISGIVRRAGTGEPIAEAAVDLEEEAADPSKDPPTQRHATTDSAGAFLFTHAIGNAYLRVSRAGYVSTSPCLRPGEDCGYPADKDYNLTVDLVPNGAVSGVITDSGRNPLPLIEVQLVSRTYDAEGRKIFSTVATSRTDDRGEYRLFNIAPGRYYLRAGAQPGQTVAKDGRQPYSRTYYPGEEDPSRATAIDVLPASETSGENFWLTRQPVFRILGHILDSRSGKPPTWISGELISNTPGEGGNSGKIDYSTTDGAFEIRGVSPGNYTLAITGGSDGSEPPHAHDTIGGIPTSAIDGQGNVQGNAFGYAAIRAKDSDLTDVNVTLAAAGTLSGRVVVTGQESAGTLPIRPPTIHLNLILDGSVIDLESMPAVGITYRTAEQAANWAIVTENGSGIKRDSSFYKEDGTFRIERLRPGIYRVSVGSLPAGYYLQETRFDGTDVLEHGLVFNGRTPGPLTIVLSANAGSVTGQVSNAKMQSQSRALIVLVPDRLRNRPDAFRTARSTNDGRFEVKNVPPGDYRAFAWINEESHAYLNPEYLAQFEADGTPIHVTGGANPALNLKVSDVPSFPVSPEPSRER